MELFLLGLTEEIGRPVRLGDVQDTRLLQRWADGVPGAPASRQLALFAVRRFLSFLKKQELIEDDVGPYVEVGPVPKRPPKFLLVEDCERLCRQPLLRPVEGAIRRALALRDAAILWVLWSGGLRASELVGLDMDRLKLDEPAPHKFSVLVLGKGNKWRWVACPRRAYRAMVRYLGVRDRLGEGDAVFLSQEKERLKRRRVYELVRQHGAAAGLPGVHPHLLRHSCATHLLWCGAELAAIQAHLGHSQVATTLQYAHTNLAYQTEKATVLHPGERPPGVSPRTLVDRIVGLEGQLAEALRLLRGVDADPPPPPPRPRRMGRRRFA